MADWCGGLLRSTYVRSRQPACLEGQWYVCVALQGMHEVHLGFAGRRGPVESVLCRLPCLWLVLALDSLAIQEAIGDNGP